MSLLKGMWKKEPQTRGRKLWLFDLELNSSGVRSDGPCGVQHLLGLGDRRGSWEEVVGDEPAQKSGPDCEGLGSH